MTRAYTDVAKSVCTRLALWILLMQMLGYVVIRANLQEHRGSRAYIVYTCSGRGFDIAAPARWLACRRYL